MLNTTGSSANGSFDADTQRHCATSPNGKVVVEGLDLPEGAIVTVLIRDDEPPVQLSPEADAELVRVPEEADREEGIIAEELFAHLQRFG